MHSLSCSLPVRSTIRAGGSEVGYSDRFVFATVDAIPYAEELVEESTVADGDRQAAVSGVLDRMGTGVLLESPASGRFEWTSDDLRVTAWSGLAAARSRPSAYSGIFAAAVQPSDLVSAIERIVEAGDVALTLAVIEATLDHASSAVRASAVGAAENLLSTHPALVARLNWMQRADPSPAVRAVIGEVLDYLA